MTRQPRDDDVIDVDEVKVPVARKPRTLAQPKLSGAGKVLASPLTGGLNLQQYLDAAWHAPLAGALSSTAFRNVDAFLAAELAAGKQVFPPLPQVFSAFNVVPPSQVRVVLIGQDPYHGEAQANGLCFSVGPTIKPPPSLVNMYKELAADIEGFVAPPHGVLTPWARQGVLMLNATLTVEAHKPNSHAKSGWQEFTDDVISALNRGERSLVFLLWGGFAQKKGKSIDRKRHRVIECAHPSPLSAKAWHGCRTFSKCNDALVDLGHPAIDWNLPLAPLDAQ